MNEFLVYCDVARSDVSTPEFALRLAMANGADTGTLSRMLPRPEGAKRKHQDWRVHGRIYPHALYSPTWHRVCPHCLRQSNYIRFGWHLTLATACALHRRRLLERCPNCSMAFDWLRPAPNLCRCGSRIDQAITVTSSSDELSFMRSFEDAAAMATGMPEVIRSLDSMQWMRLVWFAGTFLSGGRFLWSVPTRRLALEDSRAIVADGMKFLQNWPKSLRRIREKLAGEATGPRDDHFTPRLIRFAHAHLPEPAFLFVVAGFGNSNRRYKRMRLASLEECLLKGAQLELFSKGR